MKKSVAMLLVALLTATAMTGCMGRDENSGSGSSSMSDSSAPSSSGDASSKMEDMLRENTTLEDIVKDVHKSYGEYGAIAMPEVLTKEMLKDQYGLDPETDVAEFYGEYSASITNSDHLIAIRAKPGRVDVVKQALEKRKADLEKQFERYDVNGSYGRAKAAQVYVRGDYVFLIGVGSMPENPDADPEFDKQVGHVREIIDSFFAQLS